ncbi:hypothetical protein LNAOJCKE_2989 [Methylorubrum aminovorans]|uniref:Uncharacterized protein n=1 Tax=Methylorubrum aminovorans TaxID=269069 RepID=A0ABQ4UEN7_9HYPH|nr:hypothetical protein [Methylorubrum aminovorans]GJE65776.1 hypothetical protein LNAOJCKE_2989 [Methylorubrum aminovorans]GMA75867.1 hypothetical protein GCM10025880_22840 [Methylorubrum aminovorans]
MAYTRQDLITLVLQNVGVLAAGQEASIEDRAAVDIRIDPKLAELAKREIFVGLNADALDPAVFLHVADIIASACRVPFGITGNKAEVLTGAAAEAEASLKLLSRQFSATAATAAFDVVRDVLEKLGVVTIGQDPSAQDRGVVSARIAPMLADLRAREITALTDLSQADPAQLRHLANILAGSCAGSFNVDPAVGDRLGDVATGAEVALRVMQRQFDTGVGTSGTFSVAQSVLELLGVVGGGQTATSKDVAVVSARFGPLLADLRARHVIDLPSVDAADPSTKHFLAAILAARCALLFGVGDPLLGGLKAEEIRAEAALRASARQLDAGTGTVGSFDLVQSVLEALGVVEAGQTASAKDRAVVSARVDPMLADLRQREIIALPSIAAADASTQLHLAAILALACALPFKVIGEALLPFQAAAAQAEAALRVIGRQFDGGVATGGTFDVVQAVLENLSVVMAGYTGSAKDRAVVSARIAPMLGDLRLREIVNLASIEAADPGVLIHLSVILTSACSQAFGKDAATRTLLAGEAAKAEISLKALARQLDTGVAVSGVFDPVQVALEHLGIVSAGQTASAKDRAVVGARLQPKFMELRGRDICGVTDLSQLSTELQGAFARLLAADCATSFAEVPPARIAMLMAAVPEQEHILRYQSFVYDVRPAMRLERFWGGRRRGGWIV